MRALVIDNNELEEFNNRYNSIEIESTDFNPLNNDKRPVPNDFINNEERRKETKAKELPSVTTKDFSASGHPTVLRRVQVKVFGMMDDLEDDSACPWVLPLDQYQDIPNIGDIVEVAFPHTNNWNLGYYSHIKEETIVNFTSLLKSITDNYEILGEKDEESNEYKDIEDKLDEVKSAIDDSDSKYNNWITNAKDVDYGINETKKDYDEWKTEQDKLKSKIAEFNSSIENGSRSNDEFSTLYNAFETLPALGLYPSNKLFNFSDNVSIECDDTTGSEKYNIFFKKTGDYIRLDTNGTVIKSSKDIRILAENNGYIRGKELQFTTVNGNDILLTENGVTILDKFLNTIKTTDKGIEIIDTNDNKVTMSSTGIKVEGNVEITGGSCKIGGTVTPTGTGSLCAIPSCLLTGAPHLGEKAQGT